MRGTTDDGAHEAAVAAATLGEVAAGLGALGAPLGRQARAIAAACGRWAPCVDLGAATFARSWEASLAALADEVVRAAGASSGAGAPA
ncbi:hypothetical protein [Angustibacter aerolatus]|uniref:Uncharacterized protein n=1 Tax=Angustibacter aerolatus TaxID=1162965 RepID=A0ABQ6JHD5_9ACTN|nr:hypothetical protein [Angustibacter aerolatus]GMA87608.1 hypothetical protein GCM10025868_28580 [Angustibacter aerolatus]